MAAHVFRFLGAPGDGTGSHWVIDSEDARHALKVLRLPSGEVVEVTDGRGRVVTGKLVPLGKEAAGVDVTGLRTEPAPTAPLHIAVGALKPGDVDDLLPALVELGMDRISIVLSRHGDKNRIGDRPAERWQRIVQNAIKQAKRAWLPDLVVHGSLEEFLMTVQAGTCWIFTAPGAESGDPVPRDRPTAVCASATSDQPVTGLVGSEKGFSDDEIQAAFRAGFKPVSIVTSVLRARTAAIAAATILAMAVPRSG
ncbi:MAG: hypothetical protein RIQ81_1970 [Pseudomonadota bacterium]|jgi:16S rRNA (uracil1498-N3)-methyltransferase